uniref:mitogen-activated protein kinase kinase n=1 Tax=Lygus hesperus TaxID=30085 RepID=A0A146LUR3_LYGHE
MLSSTGTLALRDRYFHRTGIRIQEKNPVPVLSDTDLTEIRVLGRGCSGKVTLCKYKPTNTLVAVKVVDIGDRSRREQVLKEIQALEGVTSDNPYILHYYNSFYKDGNIHIALEYMDRGSLQSIIEKYGP